MKCFSFVLVTIFSMTSLAKTEKSCLVRDSKYEILKINMDNISSPKLELGEENATFLVDPTGILQFGKFIPAEKCQALTTINDDSMFIADWRCTPAFDSTMYFSYVRFTLNKKEQTGHLHYGFTDVKSTGGPERHIDFSCK